MKQLINNKIQELRDELVTYNIDELNESITDLQQQLETVVGQRSSIIDSVNQVNSEIVYWLDVLDRLEALDGEMD